MQQLAGVIPKGAAMKLDLQRDFKEIYAHVLDRVRNFRPKGKNVLGKTGPVKAVEIGFEYGQAGWFVVVFDTRPDAGPDGEWTNKIEGNELERPHWVEASEANQDGPITIVRHNGTSKKLPAGSELADPLGEMIKAVVLKARKDGVFADLPKAKGCELLIEHFDGGYGWPAYEARGQKNLVNSD